MLPPWNSSSIPATKDHTNETLLSPFRVFILSSGQSAPPSTQSPATVGNFPEVCNLLEYRDGWFRLQAASTNGIQPRLKRSS